MNISDLKGLYFHLWFLTFPITFFLLRLIVLELLDLFLNNKQIDKMLLHSDNLDINSLEKDFLSSKQKQILVSQPYMSEVLIQMKFKKYVRSSNYSIKDEVVYFTEKEGRSSSKKKKKTKRLKNKGVYITEDSEIEDIIIGKRLSDLFKIH